MSEENVIHVRVIDKYMYPHYTGTPEEVAKWIEEYVPENGKEFYSVVIGSSKHPASVGEFLEGVEKRRESIFRVKHRKVMDLIKKSMDLALTADPTMDDISDIADEIMKVVE